MGPEGACRNGEAAERSGEGIARNDLHGGSLGIEREPARDAVRAGEEDFELRRGPVKGQSFLVSFQNLGGSVLLNVENFESGGAFAVVAGEDHFIEVQGELQKGLGAAGGSARIRSDPQGEARRIPGTDDGARDRNFLGFLIPVRNIRSDEIARAVAQINAGTIHVDFAGVVLAVPLAAIRIKADLIGESAVGNSAADKPWRSLAL
jgi:hypothetical protein